MQIGSTAPIFTYINPNLATAEFSSGSARSNWVNSIHRKLNKLTISRTSLENKINLSVHFSKRGKTNINKILLRMGIVCKGIPDNTAVMNMSPNELYIHTHPDTVYTFEKFRLKIEKKIGHGVWGDVFLATDVNTNENYAVKILRTDFDSEALQLKKIQEAGGHEHVVKYFEHWKCGGSTWIVMEFIDGVTRNDYKGEWTKELDEQYEAAKIFLEGLGIIREENNFSNIMITTVDGLPKVKVIDFGTRI